MGPAQNSATPGPGLDESQARSPPEPRALATETNEQISLTITLIEKFNLLIDYGP